MPESTNTSFIPKRNPNRNSRINAPQRVFIGVLIARIFFFAVLLATLSVFLYERMLKNELDSEVVALNNAIASFSEVEMQRILDVDTRLFQVNNRLAHTVSIFSLFDSLEKATLGSIQIQNLEFKRENDTTLTMKAEMKTDSFDSVLFQRGVLERNDKLVINEIEDLTISSQPKNQPANSRVTVVGGQPEDLNVIFKASMSIDASKIPHMTPEERQIDGNILDGFIPDRDEVSESVELYDLATTTSTSNSDLINGSEESILNQ